MKPLTAVGLVLILLGVLGFATGGLTFTHRHTDLQSSNVEISHDRREHIPLTPYFSTVALVAGLGMVVFAGRAK